VAVTDQRWVQQWFYDVMAVRNLPAPGGIKFPPCMVRPRSWLWRRYRQLVPRHEPRSCCWHHGGDWHRASATAIRLVRAAEAAGRTGADIAARALAQARAEGISGWQFDAIESLVDLKNEPIQLNDPGDPWPYQEGRHRVVAMFDAGVRNTLVARYELLDPDTGQPLPVDTA
jgi:hypothetical protein